MSSNDCVIDIEKIEGHNKQIQQLRITLDENKNVIKKACHLTLERDQNLNKLEDTLAKNDVIIDQFVKITTQLKKKHGRKYKKLQFIVILILIVILVLIILGACFISR